MTAPDGAGVPAVFARQVRARRLGRGWLLRDLAEASGVGISTLSRAENGAGITLVLADRIARGLGVPLAALLPDAACGHCLDAPRAGFTCQACETAGPEVTS